MQGVSSDACAVIVKIVFVLVIFAYAPECAIADTKPDAAPFAIKIKPLENNPQRVVVSVTAAEASAWSALQERPDLQRAVLSLRRLEDSATARKPVADGDAPSIIGRYEITGSVLRFRPAFALPRGGRFAARFDPSAMGVAGGKPVIAYHATARRESAKPPRVVSIHPSGDTLPANHLKFYITFSEPMQHGDIFPYFRLHDVTRDEFVPRPFRHTELWSPDGKQLTLWFHPGRQKRGVNLNVEIGPILEKGNAYRLSVDGDWPSEKGAPLGREVVKKFKAGPDLHSRVDPARWRVSAPAVGSRAPLRVKFDRPLDWALLHSQMHVERADGEAAKGRIVVDDHETRWSFTPQEKWSSEEHHLAIGLVLEDLAGNSVERQFEIDLASRAPQSKSADSANSPTKKTVYLPFRPSKQRERLGELETDSR